MWKQLVHDKGIIKILTIAFLFLFSNFVNSSTFYCNDQTYHIETPSLYFGDDSKGNFERTDLAYIDYKLACDPKEYLKYKSLNKSQTIVTYETPSCSPYTQALYASNISLASNILLIVEQGREGFLSRIKYNTLPIMVLEVGSEDFNLLGCKYDSSSLLPGTNRWDNLRNSLTFSIFQYFITAISAILTIFSLYILFFIHRKLESKIKITYALIVLAIIDSILRLIYSLDIISSKGIYPLVFSHLLSIGINLSPIIFSYFYINYIKSILFLSSNQMNEDTLLKKKEDMFVFIGFSIIFIGIFGFSIATAIKMDGFSHIFYKVQIILSSSLYIILSLSKLAVTLYYILSKYFQAYSKLSNDDLSTTTEQSTYNNISESLKSIGLSSKFLIGSTILMTVMEIIISLIMIVSTRLNIWSFFVRLSLSFGVCYGFSLVQFLCLFVVYSTSIKMNRHLKNGEEKKNNVEMDVIEMKKEGKTCFNGLNQKIKDYDKIDLLLKKNKIKSMSTKKMKLDNDLFKFNGSNDKKKNITNQNTVPKIEALKSEKAFSDKIVLDDVSIFVGKV